MLLLPALLSLCILYRARHRPSLSLPPGPPGRLPVLGHLLQFPRSYEWLAYQHWSSKLGESQVYLDIIVGEHIVVLNSFRAAKDLLEGRSALYSDRPKLFALRDILGMDWLQGLMPFGKMFHEVRKAANKYLSSTSIKDYQQLQLCETQKCLKKILKQPEEYVQHFRESAGGAILGAAYGIQLHAGDRYIHTVSVANAGLSFGLSAQAFIYDVFPIVKWLPDWLPGLGFRKEAQRFIGAIAELPDLPLQETKTAMENDTAHHSIAASMLGNKTLDQNVIRTVTGTMYLAGTETTVATLTNFILAMVKYPEAQCKAQAEIDTVIGMGRLPDFKDEPSLPYINALVKEVMRWRIVTPLATPHCLIADDVYNGFHLPKDSIVIGNTFAIMHDELLFPNPDLFIPERYLDPAIKLPDVVFGFGSRICPGRYFSKSLIWITIVSILSTFTISKALDEEGNELEVSDKDFTSGVVSFPVPFQCRILPRSKSTEIVLENIESDHD
ncbi:cytochrome P450 [Mycena belliarum]|uniref:Cytochrome P450 n=1 Tax=Mycena belliarum TaxID=1033014 RepID=A0AAD6TZJ3_9AGAR|nr:cytochrome P450 [Mycena belliae]